MLKSSLTEVYFSIDIEADGPLPVIHSMVSIGCIVAGKGDGEEYERSKVEEGYHSEVCPTSDNWIPDALKVSTPTGMTAEDYRKYLLNTAPSPQLVMDQLARYIKSHLAPGERPIMVAWPASFDFPFVNHYFEYYSTNGNPFGFSGVRCIKQEFAMRAKQPIRYSVKRNVPKHLKSHKLHTHNALDDAREQGDLFSNIMEWNGKL